MTTLLTMGADYYLFTGYLDPVFQKTDRIPFFIP
jgi:hypothetical protein